MLLVQELEAKFYRLGYGWSCSVYGKVAQGAISENHLRAQVDNFILATAGKLST